MSTYFVLFWLCLAAASLGAARWGEWPERTVAALFFTAAAVSMAIAPVTTAKYHGVEAGVFMIDLLLLAALLAVAVRADRWWPICASSFQALAVLSHVGKAMNPDLWRYGYQLMAVWSALPTVICLAAGVLRQRDWQRTGGISPGSSMASKWTTSG